jgi:hypothetical protein
LDQFDQRLKDKFMKLFQLFGIGVKPEFPLSPNGFVLFFDSISGKILQLQERVNRYEREITEIKELLVIESIFHSNSLITFWRQNDRRISLLKERLEE